MRRETVPLGQEREYTLDVIGEALAIGAGKIGRGIVGQDENRQTLIGFADLVDDALSRPRKCDTFDIDLCRDLGEAPEQAFQPIAEGTDEALSRLSLDVEAGFDQ